MHPAVFLGRFIAGHLLAGLSLLGTTNLDNPLKTAQYTIHDQMSGQPCRLAHLWLGHLS
jgi:hypothetical protein